MIPVTVLTGFLGSGKTTLLARLVRHPAFARTAVIINEFGAIGIDHDLVAASTEQLVALETGCLCCTIRGDLEATLADLVARRDAGTVAPFERIVIETSGLADPAPVLNAVMAETAREGRLMLDGIVVTLDAVAGLATLKREPQSVRQVAVADRLVLTKRDLLDGEPDALIAEATACNPCATWLRSVNGDIDPVLLLAGGLAAPAWQSAEIEGWLAADRTAAARPRPATLDHDDAIQSISLRRQRPLPALALTLLLEALADHCGQHLLRLKGLVHIAERPDAPAVVHGVQHVFHAPHWLAAWPSPDRSTRLVLIGRHLSALWLERLIDAIEAEVREKQGPS